MHFIKRLIAISVWIIIILGLIFYLLSHIQDIKKLLNISFYNISMLSFLFLSTQILNGLRLMIIMQKVGIKIGKVESFSLSNLNTLINYLPLKGGYVVLAVYLKNKHNLSYTNFIKITVANNIIMIIAVTFFLSLFIIINYIFNGIFFRELFYIFSFLFGIILIAILLLKIIVAKVKLNFPFWEKVKKILAGFNIILHDKTMFFKLMSLNFISIIIMGMRLFLSFRILSFNAPLILSFITGGIKILALLLSIIPAGLGIAELFAGGASGMMNINSYMGVYAASIDRIVSIIALLILSSFSLIFLHMHRHIKVS